MRVIHLIEKICIHISMICSLTLIVLRILDWYNPFMDFSGHAGFVLYILCVVSMLFGLIYICTDKKVPQKKPVYYERRN